MKYISVFREPAWRNDRHLLNPSKWKEYELHAMGLGLLNNFNIFPDYIEKFTHIDELTQEAIDGLHRKTRIHIIRKQISQEEESILKKNKFALYKTWGTLILDTSKEIHLDGNTSKNIRKGESRLLFFEIASPEHFKEYYDLFKLSRKELGFKTPAYNAYKKLMHNQHYKVYAVKDNETGAIVAGMGTIKNEHYMLEVNAARDKTCFFANDFLKWKLIQHCKEKGISYYDFAGCNPHPEEGSKDFNLRKFKEKWGGEFYYEYIFRR
jgi:lipid II:glycine glycyltransferase (peptidoglycan interpeptide bridge formation enzyme)